MGCKSPKGDADLPSVSLPSELTPSSFPRVGKCPYSVVSMPTDEELEDLIEGEAVSVDPCCSLGDDGAEESGVAISSMSE